MKRVTLVLIAIILTLTSIAQIKINYGQVKTPPDKGDLEYGIWYRFKGDSYVYTFKKSPVGVFKAMTMINNILKENGMKYEEYFKDESLISSLVKDMTDYENLDLTITVGKSNIERIWVKGDDFLKIMLTEEAYAILAGKRVK